MVGLLLAMTMVVQDSGAFVVRLGTDTLVIEQYTRSASQLRGVYVIRSPLVIAFEPGALTVSWDKTKISVPVSRK